MDVLLLLPIEPVELGDVAPDELVLGDEVLPEAPVLLLEPWLAK